MVAAGTSSRGRDAREQALADEELRGAARERRAGGHEVELARLGALRLSVQRAERGDPGRLGVEERDACAGRGSLELERTAAAQHHQLAGAEPEALVRGERDQLALERRQQRQRLHELRQTRRLHDADPRQRQRVRHGER